MGVWTFIREGEADAAEAEPESDEAESGDG